MTGAVEERSQALLTAEHLARLGRLVSRAHEQLKARRPDLAGTLVAGVLAQGAAAATDAADGFEPLLKRLQTTPVPLSAGERLPTAGGVPDGPGLYAWWAAPRSLPEVAGPPHPARPGLELLYVGIARDLRKRVLANHAHGGTGQSTLRRAPASLLSDQEGYRTRRTSRTVLVAEDEQRLSGWIRDHLQLTWAEHPSPEAVEGEVIDTLAPPLNQAGNRTHPLYAVVRDARARWRRSAG